MKTTKIGCQNLIFCCQNLTKCLPNVKMYPNNHRTKPWYSLYQPLELTVPSSGTINT